MAHSRNFKLVTTHQARVQPKTGICQFFLVSVKHEPGVWSVKQISWGRLVAHREWVKGFSLNYFLRVLPKKRLHSAHSPYLKCFTGPVIFLDYFSPRGTEV